MTEFYVDTAALGAYIEVIAAGHRPTSPRENGMTNKIEQITARYANWIAAMSHRPDLVAQYEEERDEEIAEYQAKTARYADADSATKQSMIRRQTHNFHQVLSDGEREAARFDNA